MNQEKMAGLSAGAAYWDYREDLAGARERILALCSAVGRPSDLAPRQWAQLIAFALKFQPDVIVELGRGWGNSTCAFTEAAELLQPLDCRVVSLCRSAAWDARTRPHVEDVVPASWFRPLHTYRADIPAWNYEATFAGAKRCLIFWDAHGYEVAECVLGGMLPLIADRPHVVIMHDLSDARFQPAESIGYGRHGLWKGNDWSGPRLRLGNIDSAVEQAVAIVDFTSRNGIPLHSSDESFHVEIGEDAVRLEEMQRLLGDDLFSLQGDWFWFTLNDGTGPYAYPHFDPHMTKRPMKQRLEQAVRILLDR